MRSLVKCLTAIFFLLVIANTAIAMKTDVEIEHLITFVENTACSYERNGDFHTGMEAAKHIKKKYDYFKKEISTAEDFIRLSATKSAVSGKKYHVHCRGRDVQDSDQWLLQELENYRVSREHRSN